MGHIPRKISVIIPVYNAEKTLLEQLDALKSQSYEGPWQLILVNNRCTDLSMEIARSVRHQFGELLIVDALEKPGRHYALNAGAKAAGGDAYLFTDAHAVVGEGWLEKMAQALQSHDFVAGGFDVDRLNTKARSRTPPFTGSKTKFMGFLPLCAGANMGVSKKAFWDVDGFCETANFCEDADISFRLQITGYQIFDCLDAIVHVRYRDTIEGLRKQMFNYGFAHVYLYDKFRANGMRRRPRRQVLEGYKKLTKVLLTWPMRSSSEKDECIRQFSAHWGRLRGSIHFRVMYL